MASVYYVVSLLMASALVYALQTPFNAPIKSPFVDIYQWKLTGLPITVSLCLSLLPVTISLCLSMSKHYFYPYQLPPTPYSHHFKLTGYGVKFLLAKYLLVQRSGKIIYGWFPRAAIHLMLQTRGASLLAPLLDEGVASSSAHFFSYIYLTSFSSFPYFNFADPWERACRFCFRQIVLYFHQLCCWRRFFQSRSSSKGPSLPLSSFSFLLCFILLWLNGSLVRTSI